MTEQEIIIITICLLSIGLILCFIAYLYFRKKYYLKSFELARSFQNDIDFKKRVEEFRKEIAIEYQDKFEKTKIGLREYYVEDALKRSKSVTKGKITEHLAPFLANDWFKPSEIVFLGSPIDMISFTNIETQEKLSLDFIEIKTGNSTLNKKQRLIRNAIAAGRIYYRVVNLDT